MKATRNTAAKSSILKLITDSPVALSHNEIEDAMNGSCNRVTIYRILDRLTENGDIHKVINTDGVMKFAACTECHYLHQHNHIHFSCTKCKEVTCLEQVVPTFHLPKNYTIEEVNFTISGICANCNTI